MQPQLFFNLRVISLVLLSGATSLVWAGGQAHAHKGVRRRGALPGSWPGKYAPLVSNTRWCLILIWHLRNKLMCFVCVYLRPWVCICMESWWFRKTLSSRPWLVGASRWSERKWTNQHAEWWKRWFCDWRWRLIFHNTHTKEYKWHQWVWRVWSTSENLVLVAPVSNNWDYFITFPFFFYL